jgi:hypothetical protein
MTTLDTSALYAITRADDDHHDRMVVAPDTNPDPYLGAAGIPRAAIVYIREVHLPLCTPQLFQPDVAPIPSTAGRRLARNQ